MKLLTARLSSLPTEVYDPRAFIPHAELLGQACAHCPRFPTAASRRSLDRVSVPVWLIILSDQLPIEALVSRYLTNKLMDAGSSAGGSIHEEATFSHWVRKPWGLIRY